MSHDVNRSEKIAACITPTHRYTTESRYPMLMADVS